MSSANTTIDSNSQQILQQLISQGKIRTCTDHFIYGTLTDSSKAQHVDDRNSSCNVTSEKFGDSAGKVFSLSAPCAAPATGLQGISNDSGFDSAGNYSIYLRQTFYFDNLTAEEKAQTIKYLVPFLQKNTPSGYGALDATPDLK